MNKTTKIIINDNLQDQLRAESTKQRSFKHSSILTPELKEAATKLRTSEDRIIIRADKSNLYVLLNKSDYIQKLNTILSDSSKFLHISRNPTEELKKKVNAIIAACNAVKDQQHFPTITGHYTPGYIYGNVKTHKPNKPLRPIISQIPTPTYNLAKQLNAIISPYIAAKMILCKLS